MPQTLIQVANAALLKIGARVVASLTENTKEASVVNARIRPVRDMLLRGHTWTAFRKISAPSAVPSDLAPWVSYFSIPADCLRILGVYQDNTLQSVCRHDIVGSRIYAYTESLRLLYVRLPQAAAESEELYPDDFAEAWACYLAAEISTALFDSPDRRQTWLDQYQVVLRHARFTGAVEQADMGLLSSDWLSARFNGACGCS